MAMMMDRNRSGFCMCDRCTTRPYRESARGSYRAREEREWREDVRDLPQGESWMQDEFDIYTAYDGYWRWDNEPLDSLPYWDAIKWLAHYHDDDSDELPPGFDGSWSTDSAHVLLMRKRNRMNRAHDSLRVLARAADGNRYAQAVVKHPRFERVVT